MLHIPGLGHVLVLQFLVFVAGPLHAFPPFAACWLTDLLRCLVPPPHVLEQVPHAPQGPHLQLTVISGLYYVIQLQSDISFHFLKRILEYGVNVTHTRSRTRARVCIAILVFLSWSLTFRPTICLPFAHCPFALLSATTTSFRARSPCSPASPLTVNCNIMMKILSCNFIHT